jgi:hypothetical protein
MQRFTARRLKMEVRVDLVRDGLLIGAMHGF